MSSNTSAAPNAAKRCESISRRTGVRCMYPAGHQLSHGSTEKNTGEWSVGDDWKPGDTLDEAPAAAKPLRWLLGPYYVVLGLIKFFRQGY